MLTNKQKKLIAKWYQADQAMRAAKELESSLRDQLIMELEIKETTKLEVSNKARLIATVGENVEVFDAKVLKLPEKLMKTAFRSKPSLDKKAFNALPDGQKRTVQKCFMTKPAKPSIKMEIDND